MQSPTLEEFQKLAASANLIPVFRKLLADFETPLSAYSKIRGQGDSFLFESVEGGEHVGRYSFLGCNPRAIIRQVGSRVHLMENGRVKKSWDVRPDAPSGDPSAVKDGLAVIEQVLGDYRPASIPGLPRFTGGAVGFIGYEFIHDVEPVVPKPPLDELGTPVMYFLVADELLIFDRLSQTITVVVNATIQPGQSTAEAYEDAVSEIERLISLLEQPTRVQPVAVPTESTDPEVVSNQTPEVFHANVLKAKEYIHAGDIFQVVGSQRFTTPFTAQPMDLYRA
ncbi:MAG: anthranilate synthase component I, partial [Verrucomicrobia bacterium]|nr:anthranilate synthase component I [Verrucomicrobiota bacterium]